MGISCLILPLNIALTTGKYKYVLQSSGPIIHFPIMQSGGVRFMLVLDPELMVFGSIPKLVKFQPGKGA
jgi:hypothetical protein